MKAHKRTIIISILIVLVAVVLFLNWRFFEGKLSETQDENSRQSQVLDAAQTMRNTSEKLTYLVSNYCLTGNIEYFRSYWDIELHGEGRVNAIHDLQDFYLEETDLENLDIIQERCTELEKAEVYAMRLAFDEYDVDEEDYEDDTDLQGYIRYVKNYRGMPSMDTAARNAESAKEYLETESYQKALASVSGSLEEFVEQAQTKLSTITRQTRTISNRAIFFQAVCIGLVVLCIVLILLQNRKMYSLRSLNENIVSAVSQEYRMIAVANLKTQQATCLKDSEGDWMGSGKQGELTELSRKYSDAHVAQTYQEVFERTVQPMNIMRRFESGQQIVSCLFQDNNKDWITLDITKSQDYTQLSPIAVYTFKNAGEIIQQQKEQRQRDEMLMYFSRDFFEVYVVDLNQGSYEIIRSAERYGNYIKNLTGDFVQLMELAIVSWTKPPYRDLFRQLLDVEEVKRRFATGTKKIEFIYESYDEKWKSLQCFPVPEYGAGNEKMIFALRDYNEEMQIRTNEVLATEAMNSIYTLVAFRDYEADRYECIHSSEKLLQEVPDKGDYADLVGFILGIIHEEDREKYLRELSDERFERDGRAECEFRLRDSEGNYHYFHEYIAKVGVSSGSRMVILIKNIDESKMHEIWEAEQLQKEIKAKEKELEMTKLLAKKSKDLEKALKQAKSANDAKSRFLSNMSHDLRTPMNAILGMARLAKKHMDDDERMNKCLDTILSSSENMLALINDVLDMNKIESGVIELHEKTASLRNVIRDVDAIFRGKCETNQQEFTIRADELRYPDVMMDELRMKQILMNLLSNAVKYTQSFGRIEMVVSQEELDEQGQCMTTFVVMDNGIGMSADFVKRVFEPFEREETILSDKVEGTGLGMAIVKNLVGVMQGTIDVDSVVNMGTKITVRIPFKISTENVDETQVDHSSVQYKYPNKHILIVEDKRINLEIVKGFLEDTELQIDEARNGKEAVEKFERSAVGEYDLIFMDIRMPVMKGDEATTTIRHLDREDAKKVPIIAMTANALESDVENSYQSGMNGHISKPIDPDEVYRCLNKWLLGA